MKKETKIFKNVKKIFSLTIIAVIILKIGFILTKNVLKIIYPTKYLGIVEKYTKETNLEPCLIYGMIKTESNFNVKSVSSSGAKGLMQIMDKTANECAKKIKINFKSPDDIFDPEINISIGIFYIKSLLKKYNNNIEMALAAYNAGMGNVSKWIKNNPNTENNFSQIIKFNQTRRYVKKVVKNKKIYENLYLDKTTNKLSILES